MTFVTKAELDVKLDMYEGAGKKYRIFCCLCGKLAQVASVEAISCKSPPTDEEQADGIDEIADSYVYINWECMECPVLGASVSIAASEIGRYVK